MGEAAPEDLLRAVLDDAAVIDVLAAAGVSADELRVAVERRCLARLEGVDEEVLRGRRVDVVALLQALNAGSSTLAGLPLPAQAALGRAVEESAALRAGRVRAEHLLVALLAGPDPVVAPAAAEVGLRAAVVRRVVARRGRRAT